MVRIRLRRVGLKKQPSYRIVVTDQRSPRDGAFIEIIGQYNPRTRPSTEIVDEARALHWLSVGAQPTDAVARILRHTGTMDRFARLRKGESVETLVAEAEAARAAAEPVSPKTRYPSPGPGEGRKAQAAAAAAAAAEAPAPAAQAAPTAQAAPAAEAPAEEAEAEEAEAPAEAEATDEE